MIKRKLIQIFLLTVAISIQLLIVPLFGDKLFLANALLCLSIIFSLRETRVESILWGAVLGGIADLLLFQQIGIYGISFVVSSYILGFVSHRMVISGVFSIGLISVLSFITVVFVALLLMMLFLGKVDFSVLLTPFIIGVFFTPVITILFDFVYRKSEHLVFRK
jgi:cell shape-determining protein MreD